MILKFIGHSDDTFGLITESMFDVDNCAKDEPIVLHLRSGKDEMLVIGHYFLAPNGTWTIGIAPVTEGIRIPTWRVYFEPRVEPHYSPVLVVECPEDTTICAMGGEPTRARGVRA